jgi:hypothetical protein
LLVGAGLTGGAAVAVIGGLCYMVNKTQEENEKNKTKLKKEKEKRAQYERE